MPSEKARGKDLGKFSTQVFFQLGQWIDVEKLEARTLKANIPMQGVMRSLGIEGRDEVTVAPGRDSC